MIIKELPDRNFLKNFTLAILKSFQKENFDSENIETINADLIPKLSDKLIEIYVERQKIIHLMEESEDILVEKNIFPVRALPFPRIHAIQQYGHQITHHISEYNKIQGLLNDASISLIQCEGPDIDLMIKRYGQIQPTKISLSAEEIKILLNHISEKTHIPLMEGVFRAAVDNFNISAIYSDVVDSKFIITKENVLNRR